MQGYVTKEAMELKTALLHKEALQVPIPCRPPVSVLMFVKLHAYVTIVALVTP